jgi:hypothetical protein
VIWATLARRYDGEDRWYLEALGIAAEGRWDACMTSLEQIAGAEWQSSSAVRDLWWRSRGSMTSERLASIIADPQTPLAEMPRYFRALDFQSHESLRTAIGTLAFAEHAGLSPNQRALLRAEALKRLEGVDISLDKARLAVLDEVLDACRGTEQFINLTSMFHASHRFADLLILAQRDPASQLAADAMAVLYAEDQCQPSALLDRALRDGDIELVSATLAAMETAADPRANKLLLALVLDIDRPLAARRGAVKALGASDSGAAQLLRAAKRQEVPEELTEAWAAALSMAPSAEIRDAAAELFPATMKGNVSLPSLAELVTAQGDADRGRDIFNTIGMPQLSSGQPRRDGGGA